MKTMRDMTAKLQDGYKNNAMRVNPKHKWCMKKNLVKNLKTENFSVLIGRETDLIDRKSEKIRFLKNKAF